MRNIKNKGRTRLPKGVRLSDQQGAVLHLPLNDAVEFKWDKLKRRVGVDEAVRVVLTLMEKNL